MAAEIHRLHPRPVATSWMCSACGVDAGCNCGAPLMSKAQKAAAAIADDTAKGIVRSDRAVAEEIGTSNHTVAKARSDATGNDFPVKEPRVGLDGKRRRMPTRRDSEAAYDPKIASEQTKQVFLLGAHESMQIAEYYGPVDAEIIETARDTAAAWSRLVSKLTKENS